MQENKEKSIEDLVNDAKGYFEARLEYTRLYLVEKVSTIVASLITNVVFVFLAILTLIFASITLGFFMSDVLGTYTRGFGCVALLYLAIALIIFFTKDKVINKAIVNVAIRNHFAEPKEKEVGDENA